MQKIYFKGSQDPTKQKIIQSYFNEQYPNHPITYFHPNFCYFMFNGMIKTLEVPLEKLLIDAGYKEVHIIHKDAIKTKFAQLLNVTEDEIMIVE